MKRKFLSLALVVAMLASMLVVVPTAGATEIADVEVTNAVGFAGDTVTVDVVVTTETMSGYQFLFEYDRTKLELVKTNGVNGTMPAGNGFAGAVDSADDSYALMNWAGTVKNAKGEEVKDADGNPIPAAFSSIFWTDTNATQHNCLAGVRAATLTFKIKEDATPGDAYVSIGYLCGDSLDSKGENVVENYQPNKIETANGTVNAEGAISFNPGKITVLPDGYVDANETPASDFTYTLWDEDFEDEAFDVADAEYAIISKYNGDDSAVVIPATIEGVPVATVKVNAFKDSAITSVVIPATVETVETAAFIGCLSLTDVYVLGSATQFGVAAVGYSGTIQNRGTYIIAKNPAIIMNGDVPMTTVHAPAGSGAATMAATPLTYRTAANGTDTTMEGTIGFNATSIYSVSFAGMTCYTTGSTTVPGQMLDDGDVTVAWKNGDTVLAPGAKMTLTADTALAPVTIAAPELVNGVSLKITEAYEDFAMRFTTTLSVNDYNALRALGKVTMGTIITPAAYVERAGALTKEALSTLNTANKYIDVPTTGYMTEADGVYTFAGSVRNFKKANRDVDYAAAFYLTVTLADGNSFTVYSAYNHNANRNLGDTMTKLAASGALKGDRLTWLEKHMASFSN